MSFIGDGFDDDDDDTVKLSVPVLCFPLGFLPESTDETTDVTRGLLPDDDDVEVQYGLLGFRFSMADIRTCNDLVTFSFLRDDLLKGCCCAS